MNALNPAGLDVNIAGNIWWGGFTAEVTITNTTGRDLDAWSYTFDSPHQLNSAPWGAQLEAESLENGLTRYTLSGSNWGAAIPAGGSITVGFNGQQGVALGQSGSLSADLLLADPQAPLVVEPSPAPEVVALPAAASPEASTMDQAHSSADHGLGHDHGMDGSSAAATYTDITTWGTFHGSNHNSEHNELVGGRTAITTEALVAYNGLRAFAGLEAVGLEAVGEWAFSQGLTNNSQAWGNDIQGVGLWYAMQGAKAGWIADGAYDPQILADIQRTARLGDPADVMAMVEQYGHEGFAEHLRQFSLEEAFINTLKMEPHYGGWMHGRTHGFLEIEGVAIAHDINHLTVLGWDQSQPFMNDTFDWPQWPALDVSDATVINYYQGIVSLGDPLGANLESLPAALAAPAPAAALEEVQAVPETSASEVVVPEAQPIAPAAPAAESTPDPITGAGGAVDVAVSGDLWWGGFTAEITLTNDSQQRIDEWAVSFTSAHRFYGEAWGVDVVTEALGEGLYRYELSGADWGRSIGVGQSMTVGFNALSGEDLARQGELSADLLLAEGSSITPL